MICDPTKPYNNNNWWRYLFEWVSLREGNDMKKEWIVTVKQNGGEYTGWIKFLAEEVLPSSNKCKLIVDGLIMEFDEEVVEFFSL